MTSNSNNPDSVEAVTKQLQFGSSMPTELLEIFNEEATDHLRTIYDGLESLKQNKGDLDALANVRRASHTLKGAAGAVGLQAATRLSHRMEDLLDLLAERRQAVSELQLQLLLCTADQLDGLTRNEYDVTEVAEKIAVLYHQYSIEIADETETKKPAEDAQLPANEIVAPPAPTLRDSTKPTEKKAVIQYVRVPLNRIDELVNLMDEMTVNRSDFQKRLSELEARIEDMQNARKRLHDAAQQVESTQSASGHSTDSVGKEDFDSLEFEKYSESYLVKQTLNEADNDVEIMSGELEKVKCAFDTLLGKQQRLIHNSQKALLRVRMVPLNGIASRLDRAVRTVSSKVGRPVSLDIKGGDIEFDKTVLDAITDPLMHLIRNAVDHGVESKEIRAAAGKPATSSLQIQTVNLGTQIRIMVVDDGAGINKESVRRKACEQGLIQPDKQLTDNELYALIFRPGFSTAKQLTDVSGRGVGMDVVANAITQLKGTVTVNSTEGVGTTFTINLPTTMGMTKAVIVEAAGKTFAVPMQSIQQIAQFEAEPEPAGELFDKSNEKQNTVEVNGESLPLLSLSNHLQLNCKRRQFDRDCPLIVAHNGHSQIAVTVDKIWGCQEIVVKPLGRRISRIPGVNGVTFDSHGSIVPILDPADLRLGSNDSLRLPQYGNDFSAPLARNNLAMVVDDSISVRRVTESFLKRVGWNVVTAKDGIDALEVLANLESAPDVFLCDMEMPRMDGLELIRQIREQTEFEAAPIVMVTSRASEKHRQKAFEAGATDYVVKPFDEQHLLTLMTTLVETAKETV